MKKFTAAALAALTMTALPASALAKTPVTPTAISPDVVAVAAKYRSDKGVWKPSTVTASSAKLSVQDTRVILRASWKAFGVSGDTLKTNVRLNLRQAKAETGLRPQAIHSLTANEPFVAGGLFQMIPQTFDAWKVAGHGDRYNPLDNTLAVVNAQVNAKRVVGANKDGVLDGTSGWSPVG